MLWTPYTRPERNEALEQRVRPQLQAYSELLDIRWIDTVYWNERQQTFEGRYAITVCWTSDDPRRAMYRSGEIGTDYDILGWFAEDLQNAEIPVDGDQIWNRVHALLTSADAQRSPLKTRMAQIAEKNRKRREDRKALLQDMTHDIASYERERALGNAIVGVTKDLT